ncbi:Brr6p NDAI_0B06290 [Naumovozyma dairenensis CBS 421]|uniref:Brl1/Brr6 domain-containing protein n=1 Tax=Naumovozyma dairenensis (strain ATCC 10597 / BCRC 20456 / CBS 421 / NBRC 0211 / NRRL Y-12639) TaxID=1071378 RepID=G0W799_NAUDC|nr:hypothetical protein NDAI_0B06290 [Naumovozyma dairenensis CBS 421]CCD23660.1 hypothetical protein NDAI_0B06290 [Naumovozyma dairenensis CBS 421]
MDSDSSNQLSPILNPLKTDSGNDKLQIPRNDNDPTVWAEYFQLAFNVLVASITLFLFIKFLYMVNRDVDSKVQMLILSDIYKIEKCKHDYEMNQCDLKTRVPALEDQCNEWFHCFQPNSTVNVTGSSSILWAQTLAEVVNAFVEPISIRTLLVLLLSTCSIIIVTNVAFGSYRVSYRYNNENNPRT